MVSFLEKTEKENQLPIQIDKLNYQDHTVFKLSLKKQQDIKL